MAYGLKQGFALILRLCNLPMKIPTSEEEEVLCGLQGQSGITNHIPGMGRGR